MHSQQKSFNGSAKILAFSFVLMTACCVAFKSSRTVLIVNALRASMDDPNFESHLPSLLKVGLSERPDYDLAQSLRSRFKKIENIKRQAADVLKTQNNELAVELMEMADEIEETTDKFGMYSKFHF